MDLTILYIFLGIKALLGLGLVAFSVYVFVAAIKSTKNVSHS